MKLFIPCVLVILLAGCAAGFWKQCVDIDAKGFYSVTELGILGIGTLRYQRNTAQCTQNEEPEQVELPKTELKGVNP